MPQEEEPLCGLGQYTSGSTKYALGIRPVQVRPIGLHAQGVSRESKEIFETDEKV